MDFADEEITVVIPHQTMDELNAERQERILVDEIMAELMSERPTRDFRRPVRLRL
jgi:hypothetical protein